MIEARTIKPTCVDVAGYSEAVAVHCPYLAPSVARGLTGWTVYEAAGDVADVEAEVFHAGVQAAEWLRPLMPRPHGVLACENIVILGAGTRLLDWPHWALKHLYGPVGIMFGKFPYGERATDRQGRSIPPPPVSFLPVRAAIRHRDPRLLQRTPDLADALACAEDDGRDVLAGVSYDWKEIKQWARALLPKR